MLGQLDSTDLQSIILPVMMFDMSLVYRLPAFTLLLANKINDNRIIVCAGSAVIVSLAPVCLSNDNDVISEARISVR